MSDPLPTDRARLLDRLAHADRFDLAVVGGGATGLGVALDAAMRGFSVVLIESHDFGKGTSSRATKLVHGGVRYLAQGNIALVREALRERSTLLSNAPHLAQPLPFVMPSYRWWETAFYGTGLKLYDALAGSAGLGATEFLNPEQTSRLLPRVQQRGLKGGVKYWDGQFNDARLALALARTAASRGALLINYCAATGLIHEAGRLVGLECRDMETGAVHRIQAGCIVNATGVWVDELRREDGRGQAGPASRPVQPMVAPSQGVHLVVDRDFLGAEVGLMVPKTADGRVLFAVPWLGKTILGTTDTPRKDLDYEPRPFPEEVAFILSESARYLQRPPQRSDVRSVWVGLRPLVKPVDDEGDNTKGLSREHTVRISRSGLVTVTGGKWTTYRAMAEDVLERCADRGLIAARAAGATARLPLAGAPADESQVLPLSAAPGLHSYGADAQAVLRLPGSDIELAPGLTEAMVRFAARHEYARRVEDVLGRRSRLLFLDAGLAGRLAGHVAKLLREETGRDPDELAFKDLARQYGELP